MNKTLPVTRYYGSKKKLIPWIWECIEKEQLHFDSVLDLFGGSGVFSYSAKLKNKQVMYNDIFEFNYHIGRALIENSDTFISDDHINQLFSQSDINYSYHITKNYCDVYYTDEENQLIDIVSQNIMNLDNEMLKSVSYYLLFQACLIKRPFNLFHRKNLYLRLNDVKRSFGNKKTWETPFRELFFRFGKEINSLILSNNRNNTSHNYNALECPLVADLVYIDPPYINQANSHVSYHTKYHFLEALVNYNTFTEFINRNKKNLEVQINNISDFENRNTFFDNLKLLLTIHQNSTIILSYRKNGIPTLEEIEEHILTTGRNCTLYCSKYSYALHKNNGSQEEALFIIR